MKHNLFYCANMVKLKMTIFACLRLKTSMIFLFISNLLIAQGQELYITEKNGNQDSYIISDLAKISFSSGNINISMTDKRSEIYVPSDLRCLSFTDLGIGTNSVFRQNRVNDIEIYPNPARDIVNVKFSGFDNEKVKLEIYSIYGKKVCSIKLYPYQKTHHIDLSDLIKGVYVCKIKNQSIKLIKK